MPLPEKAYDRLFHLQKIWGLSQNDIYYAVENGMLRVCVWMPLRYLERGAIKNKKFVFEQCEHKAGFVGIRQQDFYHICSTGCAKLRIFHSIDKEGIILRMAYEPPQPAISVRIADLIVMREDREKFETDYKIEQKTVVEFQKKEPIQEFSASDDYRHVQINSKDYQLGDVQAQIIQLLHDAARSRNPWIHGKTLLHDCHSKAMRLRDVFKNKPDWRQLIMSDERGYYRLNIGIQPAEDDQLPLSLTA